MAILYQQTDLPVGVTGVGCSADSTGIINKSTRARVGGPAGTEEQLCGIITSGTCFHFSCDPPALAEWPLGIYIAQLNIVDIHEDLYLDYAWFCDWDESTYASVVALDITTHSAGTTGVFNAVFNRGTTYTVQDAGLSRPTFFFKFAGGTGTVTILPNQLILTPIIATVTGASPGVPRQPMTNQYHPNKPTRVQ